MAVNKVKNKTKQLIIRILVVLIVIAMLFSMVLPILPINAKTKYVVYNNKSLKASVKIPKESKSKIKKLSNNSVEIPIHNNLLIRVTYGNIYQETLKSEGLSKEDISKRELYIKSDIFEDTWNSKKYIKKYFKDIFSSDKRVSYSFDIKRSKLSSLPAWECKYRSNKTASSGYYYLTVVNGGLYILQFDSYMKKISAYKETKNRIKKSYKINKILLPLSDEEKAELAKQEEEIAKNNPSESEKGKMLFTSTLNFIIIAVAILIVGYFVWYFINAKKSKKMKERRQKIREEKKDD